MNNLLNIEQPAIEEHFRDNADIVLFQGDCLEELRNVPDDVIKLVISSPPYNIGKEYENTIELDKYIENFRDVLRELVRTLSPNGSICWQVGNFVQGKEVYPLDVYFYPIFKELGLKLKNRIIWHFNHGLHCSKRFSGRYETILWFTKTDNYTFNLDNVRVPSKYPGKTHYKKGKKYGKPSGNPLGKNPSDRWEMVLQDWEKTLWDIPNVKANHPEKTIHPCQFPIELVQRCVLALTDEKDWVLDPFAGVGSALIAALMHDRRAFGCEMESKYVEETLRRIDKYYNNELRIRPIGKPVYKPTGREKVSQVPKEWHEKGLFNENMR